MVFQQDNIESIHHSEYSRCKKYDDISADYGRTFWMPIQWRRWVWVLTPRQPFIHWITYIRAIGISKRFATFDCLAGCPGSQREVCSGLGCGCVCTTTAWRPGSGAAGRGIPFDLSFDAFRRSERDTYVCHSWTNWLPSHFCFP